MENLRITDYTLLDMEMTGLSPKSDKVIEIGAIRIRKGQENEVMSCLVNPRKVINERVVELTGITNEMAAQGRDMDEAMSELLEFIGDDILVGQNIRFDYSFLAQWCINKKKSIHIKALDTLKIARALLPPDQSKKLEDLCTYYQVPRVHAHRALDDARETGLIFEIMQNQLFRMEDCECRERLLKPELLVYKAKKQTPATAYQIRDLKAYMERHQLEDHISWETLTRGEASRLQDFYYSTYGR